MIHKPYEPDDMDDVAENPYSVPKGMTQAEHDHMIDYGDYLSDEQQDREMEED